MSHCINLTVYIQTPHYYKYKYKTQPHSSILLLKGTPSLIGLSAQKTINTPHLFWSPSTIEMSSPCSHLSNFKITDSLDLHLQRNTTGKENKFLHSTKCYLLPKVFKLQVLRASHQYINQDWRSNLLVLKVFPRTNFSWSYMNYLQLFVLGPKDQKEVKHDFFSHMIPLVSIIFMWC